MLEPRRSGVVRKDELAVHPTVCRRRVPDFDLARSGPARVTVPVVLPDDMDPTRHVDRKTRIHSIVPVIRGLVLVHLEVRPSVHVRGVPDVLDVARVGPRDVRMVPRIDREAGSRPDAGARDGDFLPRRGFRVVQDGIVRPRGDGHSIVGHMDRSEGIQVHLKGQHPLVGRGRDERFAPSRILRRDEKIVSRGAPIRRRIGVPNVDPTNDRAPVWLQSEIDRIAADRTRRDDRGVACHPLDSIVQVPVRDVGIMHEPVRIGTRGEGPARHPRKVGDMNKVEVLADVVRRRLRMNNGCRRTRSAAEDAERQAEDEHDGGEADQDPSVYTIRLRDEKTLRTPGPRHELANLLIVGVPWSTLEKSRA